MSKKYKGRRCVYCTQAVATEGDHVFAREFFLPEHRRDLPQVPACSQCNGRKAKLEHYITATLPFGGRHVSARRNLSEMVPRRLKGNAKLHRQLREHRGRTWTNENGIYIRASTVPIDANSLIDLFRYVVRGLVAFHWGTYLEPTDDITVVTLTELGDKYFDRLLALNTDARAKANLGQGTFRYEGAQAMDCPNISVWRIEAYGGVKFMDRVDSDETASRIGALTGPHEARQDSRT